MNDIVRNPPIDGFGNNITSTPERFDKIADVPTEAVLWRKRHKLLAQPEVCANLREGAGNVR